MGRGVWGLSLMDLGGEFLDSLGEFFECAFGHLLDFASSLGDVPEDAGGDFFPLVDSEVACVGVDFFFFSVKKWAVWLMSETLASGTDSTLKSMPEKYASIGCRRGCFREPRRPVQNHCRRKWSATFVQCPPVDDLARLWGNGVSMTPTSRAQGTTFPISLRNFSLRVIFFFPAYSVCAKLICLSMQVILSCLAQD